MDIQLSNVKYITHNLKLIESKGLLKKTQLVPEDILLFTLLELYKVLVK